LLTWHGTLKKIRFISLYKGYSDADMTPKLRLMCVSIPAVHADGDHDVVEFCSGSDGFNPRRPRGRRLDRASRSRGSEGFQSPPSTRTATSMGRYRVAVNGLVSIPAVHADGDSVSISVTLTNTPFQSPPSTRTATRNNAATIHAVRVSIPAVHADGDHAAACLPPPTRSRFNPRRPRGRRRCPWRPRCCCYRFQSPPSTRTATTAPIG